MTERRRFSVSPFLRAPCSAAKAVSERSTWREPGPAPVAIRPQAWAVVSRGHLIKLIKPASMTTPPARGRFATVRAGRSLHDKPRRRFWPTGTALELEGLAEDRVVGRGHAEARSDVAGVAAEAGTHVPALLCSRSIEWII
jgi:hypothetical protein